MPSSDALLQTFLLVGGFPELLAARRSKDLEEGLLRSQQVLRAEAVQRVTGMDIPQAFDVRSSVLLERLLYEESGVPLIWSHSRRRSSSSTGCWGSDFTPQARFRA